MKYICKEFVQFLLVYAVTALLLLVVVRICKAAVISEVIIRPVITHGYMHSWVPLPPYGGDERKAFDWYVEQLNNGWEPVGLPSMNNAILMRKKLTGGKSK